MPKKVKDSGIDWIGEIPEGWDIKKVKNLFVRKKEKANQENPTILSLARSGIKVRDISTGEGQIAADYTNYNPVKPNDLLLNPMDLISGDNCNVSKVYGVISPAYINLAAKSGVNPRYYNYYFKLQYWLGAFFAHGKGVSFDNRWTLNDETLQNYPLIFPSIKEQEKIANFLDEKMSLIDGIIEDTKHSIEGLKQYRQALITATVTKGINNEVEMKHSEIDWIGKTPIHWSINKVNRLFEIKKIIANENGHNVLSVTQKGLKIKDVSKNEGQMAADYSKYQIVDKDDFVMNHMDLLTGWVDCSIYEGVTSPDYRVFRNRNSKIAYNPYYKYVFQTCYTNKIFYGLGQGVSNLGRWRLQTDKFLNFYLPVPPLDEQTFIARYLSEREKEINAIISDKEEFISELENYKRSVTYEYVTGKREVL